MPASERRVVAVRFSDLSGFTSLASGRDPEEVRDLMDALFSRFRAAIESLGGTVDKFIGDAVMAVFGAPAAHADDDLRAAQAGLALQRETAAFNAERGLDLRLRVGVNVGEVFWGSVGGGAPTAMGDPVKVAQRLEGAAVERLARARVGGGSRAAATAGRRSSRTRRGSRSWTRRGGSYAKPPAAPASCCADSAPSLQSARAARPSSP